ncbi:M20/M25/M40 family metallo-hydrolase [Microbacteriaceae bacterium VKM Ac-2854]|nr:M20/M25/M40 family metallo-hydrolase [Microbacteriaceae bacterium VKM Ac-2854]
MTHPSSAATGFLRAYFRDHREQMLADARHLVMIESPSDSVEALDELHAYLVHWVAERLGRPHAIEHARRPGAAPVTSWTYAGTEPLSLAGNGNPERFIALLGHYDTVWPLGTTRNWPFTVDGDRVDGPGTYDMKLGLVQIVWAVAALRASGLAHPGLRILFNGDEETGSVDSRAFLEKECRGARAALVFEGALKEKVKTARKGIGHFLVDVFGVEAHAGVEPEKGASAIHELGTLIPQILALADPDAGTTINIGLIHGGSRVNVTAGHTQLELEARITNGGEADRVDAAMAALRASDPRIRIEVRGSWHRPVFERTPPVVELYRTAETVARRAGIPIGETAVGGASDGNLIAAIGVPVLDGLGPIGSGAHARGEHATVSGMLERAELAALLISALA